MIILVAFLFWLYQVPPLRGLEEDERESAEATSRHIEEISFESGRESFFKLQQKYDTR